MTIAFAPNLTEDSLRGEIRDVQYMQIGHLTICVMTLKNGWMQAGSSHPVQPKDYNEDIGKQKAYDEALAALYTPIGYSMIGELEGGPKKV